MGKSEGSNWGDLGFLLGLFISVEKVLDWY